eukprot:13270757-Ditylum_brightwellii.AAC.1
MFDDGRLIRVVNSVVSAFSCSGDFAALLRNVKNASVSCFCSAIVELANDFATNPVAGGSAPSQI